MRALKSFLQNHPTIVTILETDLQECRDSHQFTRARELEKKIKKLRDPRFLLLLIGLAQILVIYSEVSLDAQTADYLPSQVWDKIETKKAELRQLASNWKWSEFDLKFVDIEAPAKIVNRLQESGVYRPKVFERNVMRKGSELREAGLLQMGQHVSSLFEEDEMIVALAGETLMEVPARAGGRRGGSIFGLEEEQPRVLTQEDEELEKGRLEKICATLVKEWEKRMVRSELDIAAHSCMGKVLCMEEGANMNTFIAAAQEELDKLLGALPPHIQEKFEGTMLLDGYCSFQNLFKELEGEFGLHQIYQKWYLKYIKVEEPLESSIVFSQLFQCVQVRSTSEAFCETVGSVMSNHCGKNRYLRPVNFNKEVFLDINLGPLHMCGKLVEEMFQRKKDEFIFKEANDGRLISGSHLVDDRLGAAIKTFRKTEEEKSKFPHIFWQTDFKAK